MDKKQKNKYQVADVAFLYLLSKYNLEDSKKVIDYINEDIFENIDDSTKEYLNEFETLYKRVEK